MYALAIFAKKWIKEEVKKLASWNLWYLFNLFLLQGGKF